MMSMLKVESTLTIDYCQSWTRHVVSSSKIVCIGKTCPQFGFGMNQSSIGTLDSRFLN